MFVFRHLSAPQAAGRRPQQLRELLPNADWVVVCCGLTDETYHLFGAREFEAMKPVPPPATRRAALAVMLEPAHGDV